MRAMNQKCWCLVSPCSELRQQTDGWDLLLLWGGQTIRTSVLERQAIEWNWQGLAFLNYTQRNP